MALLALLRLRRRLHEKIKRVMDGHLKISSLMLLVSGFAITTWPELICRLMMDLLNTYTWHCYPPLPTLNELANNI